MKIVSLQAENVKRLKAVEITPDGSVVTIGGRNAQGKSSILDSIEYALGGKPKIDRPIRDGERSARVILKTEDLTVTRTFNGSGSQLKVESSSGLKIASPQGMLDKLYGSMTFDPFAFSRKKPKEQAEALRELVGIDLSELDKERAAAYEERTLLNREIKSIDAQADGLPMDIVEPVSIAALTDELETMNKHNAKASSLANDSERMAVEHESCMTEIERLRQEIGKLEEKYQLEKERLESINRKHSELIEEIKNHQPTSTDAIRQAIADAEQTNAKAAQSTRRKELIAQANEKQAVADKLTETIKEIDAEKQATLAEADFPMDGLAFDEAGVTMNGIPFEQCSSAEQLRISVAMGFAMNPELRVLLIREGSLLDNESMAIMKELAEEHDGQLWVEVVSQDGAGCTVMIEDGAIIESEEK